MTGAPISQGSGSASEINAYGNGAQRAMNPSGVCRCKSCGSDASDMPPWVCDPCFDQRIAEEQASPEA